MWTLGKKSTRSQGFFFILNTEALEEELRKPKDRKKFEKHRGTWYHARCWKWHLSLKKSIQEERKTHKLSEG
jgi:hypothetical protein